jgi:hypothetical protein
MKAIKGNRVSRVWARAVALGALAGACGTAWAANPGWFGGVRFGTRSVDAPVASLAQDPDATLNLFRYPIRLKLGMEIGVTERDWAQDIAGPGLRFDGRLGWQVLGIGSVPITRNWGVFGKLGAFRWTPDYKSSFGSITGDDAQPTYGLGLKYSFTDNLSVSGEWDRYQLQPGLGPNGEIDLLSIGLKYRF